MQDRLDSGISLLICCPRSHAMSTLSPKCIAVDLYVRPRELHKVHKQIAGDVLVLVQAFYKEFAIPHFQCFTELCCIKSVQAPHCCLFAFFLHIIALTCFVQRSCSLSEPNWASCITSPTCSNQLTHSMFCPPFNSFQS